MATRPSTNRKIARTQASAYNPAKWNAADFNEDANTLDDHADDLEDHEQRISDIEANPGGGGGIVSVSSTDNHIQVDNTDPANPSLSFLLVDNENLLTDAELVVVQATSGTNTGDQNASTTDYSPTGETGGNLATNKVNLQDAVKEVREWVNTPSASLGSFTGDLIVLNKTGSFTDKTLSENLSITFAESGMSEGNGMLVTITTSGAYSFSITKPANYSLLCPSSFVNADILLAGTYLLSFWFIGGSIKFNLLKMSSVAGVVQLTAPTIGTVTADSGDQITVNWTDTNTSPNESGFRVYYDTVNTFDSVNLGYVTTDPNYTSAAISGLDELTTYYVRVVAIGNGVTGATSDPSSTGSATTLEDFSAEVQAVLDRMTGLTSQEITAIADYVTAEVTAGNWAKIDEVYCLKLAGANSLVGFKTKTATNHSASKVAKGYQFTGANYISSGYTPSVDAVNFTLLSAFMGIWIDTHTATGHPYGGTTTVPSTVICQYDIPVGGAAGINATGGAGLATPPSGSYNLLNKDNYRYYLNGVSTSNLSNSNSVILSNVEMFFGCRNLNGSPTNYWQGISSFFAIGGGSGFDHLAHYNNVAALMAALD